MAKKPSHRTIDPSKVTPGTLERNPHLAVILGLKTPVEQPWNARQGASEAKKAPSTPKAVSDGPTPNKTEARFQAYFERLHKGSRLDFHPITLRIGKRRYTPDWVLWDYSPHPLLLEIKGPYIYEKNKLKYDLFKTIFGDRFVFQMWQEENRTWTHIR